MTILAQFLTQIRKKLKLVDKDIESSEFVSWPANWGQFLRTYFHQIKKIINYKQCFNLNLDIKSMHIKIINTTFKNNVKNYPKFFNPPSFITKYFQRCTADWFLKIIKKNYRHQMSFTLQFWSHSKIFCNKIIQNNFLSNPVIVWPTLPTKLFGNYFK